MKFKLIMKYKESDQFHRRTTIMNKKIKSQTNPNAYSRRMIENRKINFTSYAMNFISHFYLNWKNRQ